MHAKTFRSPLPPLAFLFPVMFAFLATLTTGQGALAEGQHNGHLRFNDGKIHAHLEWITEPNTHGDEAKLRLEWHNGLTHQLMEPDFQFDVILWMPSMGHGSAPTSIARINDANGNTLTGTFAVSNMYFIMPGDWEVRFAIKYADGREEVQSWAVPVEIY